MLKQITMTLRNANGKELPVYIDVDDNSLSKKWIQALTELVQQNYHLEKNFCFLGFPKGPRTPEFLCEQINNSIDSINSSGLGYHIDDHFTLSNTVNSLLELDHSRMNDLHRYFEDLQGTAQNISPYYNSADASIRWHIRQLNLLCHEYESLILSVRKLHTAPEWQRPSQLMCWLQAPRFQLEKDDYELFGVDTINRKFGGVYVGVNKAVGKHHWEVFNDEGKDSRIGELTTSVMHSQTLAAGDFDIEWGKDPGGYPWQKERLLEFRQWLINNGFDPDDKSLTIGHPQVAQVNLIKSFGTTDYIQIWNLLGDYADVYKISIDNSEATYNYRWSDSDFAQRQIDILQGH